MLELGRDLDFAGESLRAQGGGEFGPQHLHRHLAAVLHILGEVDRGHPAGAELPLDRVAAGQRGGQPFLRCGHEGSPGRSG